MYLKSITTRSRTTGSVVIDGTVVIVHEELDAAGNVVLNATAAENHGRMSMKLMKEEKVSSETLLACRIALNQSLSQLQVEDHVFNDLHNFSGETSSALLPTRNLTEYNVGKL